MESISKVARRLNHQAAAKDDRTTERGEAIQAFLDRINPGREAMKLKPLTFGAMARRPQRVRVSRQAGHLCVLPEVRRVQGFLERVLVSH